MSARNALGPLLAYASAWAVCAGVSGCGGDDESRAKGRPDGGLDTGAAGSDGGEDAGPDVAPEAAPDVALPDTPFGPSFVGVAENVDGTAPDDIALGLFLDAAAVTIPHVGADCVAYSWTDVAPPGRDVGAVSVSGGSVSSPVTLARDDNSGSYYLDQPADAWSPGDDLTLSAEGRTVGPVRLPTELTSETLSTQSAANRDGALPLVFGGSDATHVAVTLSARDDGASYLLICLAAAAGGSYAVPAAAMGSIPAAVVAVNVKLSPVNVIEDGDFAFFAAGQAVEADLAVMQ